MGHILGADGLQADPEKITAICEMPRPTDNALLELSPTSPSFCHSSVLFVNPPSFDRQSSRL